MLGAGGMGSILEMVFGFCTDFIPWYGMVWYGIGDPEENAELLLRRLYTLFEGHSFAFSDWVGGA